MSKGANYGHYQYMLIKFAFNEFEQYNKQVEGFFVKASEDIDKEYDRLAKKYKRDEVALSNLSEDFSERYQLSTKIFPNTFRVSFFSQIMSYIVYQLREICDLHSRIKETKSSVEDYDGSDLEKCKKYLRNKAKVDFSDLNVEWQFLTMAYALRNKFVHHYGKVETKSTQFKNLEVYRKRFGYFDYKYITEEIESSHEVTVLINKKFIEAILNTASSFFKRLLKEKLEIRK